MFKITKKSIILTLLATVIFPSIFIVSMFTPRAEITYNCDGYEIYKMVAPLPSSITTYPIDKKTLSEGTYPFRFSKDKAILVSNYFSYNTPETIEYTKDIFQKYYQCKSFNYDILTNIDDKIGSDSCYLSRKLRLFDYPDCSPEIKAKFELK